MMSCLKSTKFLSAVTSQKFTPLQPQNGSDYFEHDGGLGDAG
jgi:hypothetical protein